MRILGVFAGFSADEYRYCLIYEGGIPKSMKEP
jgi:hypothetical protein